MARWKQHYDKPFLLYHLSEEDKDGQELVPRKLDKDRVMEKENWWTKRICVSSSILGALTAIGYDDYDCIGKQLYVHVPENLEQLFKNDKIYKPSLKQVPDSGVTDEFWIKAKTRLKCIGKILITDLDSGIGDESCKYMIEDSTCWTNRLKYEEVVYAKKLS